MAYFLPTEGTLEKRREDMNENRAYEDEFEYEYMMAREYNWTVKSKASRGYEENYFLVVRQDGAYFNELETRFVLILRMKKIIRIDAKRIHLLMCPYLPFYRLVIKSSQLNTASEIRGVFL